MKKLTVLFLSSFLLLPAGILLAQETEEKLIEMCVKKSGKDATYLKDFKVKFDASNPDERPKVARFPLVLSKNNIYRFSVCNSEQYDGRAVLQLYDSNQMIFSSINKSTGEEYNPFNFKCNKTGVYHVFISFLDGKEGYAVGVLSYVEK